MTDFRRAILMGILMMIGIMLFNAWNAEHAPARLPNSTVTSSAQTTVTSTSSSAATTNQNQIIPTAHIPNRTLTFQTNTLAVTIDRLGGNITKLKLLKYPISLQQKNDPIELFSDSPEKYYLAQSGFTLQQPVVFNAVQKDHQVILTAQVLPQNLKIIKTYTFQDNDYLITLDQKIMNAGNQIWQGRAFVNLQRTPPPSTGMGPFNFNTYTGAAISSPEKRYDKISFKEMGEHTLDQSIQNGWAAMLQHYFISAWIPNPKMDYHYTTSVNDNVYTISIESPPIQLNPGQQYSETQRLYTGPAEGDKLAKIAPGLNLTIDYGVLWFIAQIIFTVMKKIHSVIGNWGWSIVLVTLLIKIIFYKLNAISFKSMAKMRDIQPKIEQLRERCGDDRQKLAQTTMELYRKEKVNPMGGCLPLLVQIPVFLSLYWVIIESVELRQAPFMWWIHDLSVKDPYYVLPLLMGLTIFIQQYLGPKSPDPTQRKVMMMMPVIFTALFLSFPSGLVLYWVANNTLSILQQWYIMNHVVKKK